ncbi:ribosomal RNA small subunit methyltransferase NEP1 [Amborella trichopoda]|uniref:Ribosomal RNA small subunit methyltransferase NEP1 n=1 Tax=Amborella trichopoda TaxID=13333 RepID=W1NVA7_AMBTC|nr:ribosomal RNA small subunit methyltransferase NEP1 [Amborella trichopoda]XP_011620791.1 ribosomal RNA small subunit methyltransferase NEP1 [Amborella trichopoda]XP_020518674.1 ribosomal RNA small subunit methyltransferase NEP1 [Amborella trichopoda]XP_020518675.1 ribosomal RNA small subunit methyltransferase NEP1 [Amborella trichopoda]ERM99248.1 hypothetical protein AMTR_s00092p00137780 [Amborella trichopoda]|eukprot:XP_006836395.1 ribosomal RNA small subunit methyltransferase NEP1 [Amborella trichopoda]
MVRGYRINGVKRKKTEKAEDDRSFEEEEEKEVIVDEEREKGGKDEEEEVQLFGIPTGPIDQKAKSGIIFVLERASLEVAKVGKTYQILNCDDHATYLKKKNRDPAAYRPDIIHQALLAVLDSPLNKAGRLKAVYVQTEKNVLIRVNPHVRIPRTIKRFCGLMVQLLQKLSIRATNGPDILLRVVKNPVTRHLPIDSRRIGLSYSSPKVVQLHDYVTDAKDDVNLVFVVGAMAHGKITADYIDDFISVSEYPLSAACCIGRICNVVERKWNIL